MSCQLPVFCVQQAKDLPRNVTAVGPILNEFHFTATLDGEVETFLARRHRVLYVSLGIHVLLPAASITNELLFRCSGIVWDKDCRGDPLVYPSHGTQAADLTVQVLVLSGMGQTGTLTVGSLRGNRHSSMFFVDYVPQPAQQPRCYVSYPSHARPALTNEGLHGEVHLVTVIVYFDQFQKAIRLKDAGVSVPLNRTLWTVNKTTSPFNTWWRTSRWTSPWPRDCVVLRAFLLDGKYHAADLTGKALVDWEGRREERESTENECHLRGTLRAENGRMPTWNSGNCDLKALNTAVALCFFEVLAALRLRHSGGYDVCGPVIGEKRGTLGVYGKGKLKLEVVEVKLRWCLFCPTAAPLLGPSLEAPTNLETWKLSGFRHHLPTHDCLGCILAMPTDNEAPGLPSLPAERFCSTYGAAGPF